MSPPVRWANSWWISALMAGFPGPFRAKRASLTLPLTLGAIEACETERVLICFPHLESRPSLHSSRTFQDSHMSEAFPMPDARCLIAARTDISEKCRTIHMVSGVRISLSYSMDRVTDEIEQGESFKPRKRTRASAAEPGGGLGSTSGCSLLHITFCRRRLMSTRWGKQKTQPMQLFLFSYWPPMMRWFCSTACWEPRRPIHRNDSSMELHGLAQPRLQQKMVQ